MRLVNTLCDRRWTDPLPIYVWVIEHPEGLIVVDTGETAEATTPGYFPRWHPYFRNVKVQVRPEEEVGPQMRRMGLYPEDVRWVILTHLHTDHAGGLRHFPDAEILVMRRAYERASGLPGQIRGFLPHRWPPWFSPRLMDLRPEPFGTFQRSLRITEAGDVVAVPTPGHTEDHISIVLLSSGTAYLFAGDASYTQEAMLNLEVDGVSLNEGKARRTLERIRDFVQAQPTVYLPTHDPESAKRLATGEVVPITS